MEINPTSRYYNYLAQNERYFYMYRILAIFIVGSAGILLIPFIIYYIRAKCTLTFTNSLRTEQGQLIIGYMKFFRNREVAFPLKETVLELREFHDDVRFPPYYQMAVRHNNKIRYTLDSREGYSRETLLTFMNGFATAQSSAALVTPPVHSIW
ncbi:hypothetical protein SAMN04488122_3609 [Chitinophaga arvensicola]|uniref:PH domain-containing protein n=2 Tax=Chitinophaga arvensicola TaxID=29529 RepID=A0A1I0S5E2_9BACT|nr:hypothetical protein SAMN04488122_3609 [Chitinophaga arvensicola]